MIDEFKANRDIDRGARAQALLDNELLKEAFDTLEAQYMQLWQATRPQDTDAREKLWVAVNVNRKVRDHLQTVLDRGKVSQRELNSLAGIQGRPRAA